MKWYERVPGQLARDFAHILRPRLPDCRFGWLDAHEYCVVHERRRLECEAAALKARAEAR